MDLPEGAAACGMCLEVRERGRERERKEAEVESPGYLQKKILMLT